MAKIFKPIVMLKLFLFFTIILLCGSCKINQSIFNDKEEVEYVYSVNSMEGTYTRLILKKNNTFKYLNVEGLTENRGNGYFKIYKSDLYLNSDSSQKSNNGKVDAFELKERNSISILFLDASRTPINNLKVLLDDKEFTTDSLGRITTISTFKTLYTNFYLDYSFFYWRNDNYNSLEIQLLPKDNSEIYFINSRYKIGKKRLTDANNKRFIKKGQ